MTAIPPPQVRTDATLCGPGVRVVAIVEHRRLDVAEGRFHGVVVGTRLGQTDPVQGQLPHYRPGRRRAARMRRVLVQRDPHRLGRISPPHAPHEATHVRGALPRPKGPAGAPRVDLVEREQVEAPSGGLAPLEDQARGRRIAAPLGGLDRDAYPIILGQPAHLAQDVRDQYNLLIQQELGLAAPPNFGLRISSAWRNPQRNEAVHGVRTSRHQYGDAVDLRIVTVPPGITVQQLWCILEAAGNAVTGHAIPEIGSQPTTCDDRDITHVHVDR